MNTRKVIDESAGPVSLSTAFNHDASCFSIGIDTGFCGELIQLARIVSRTY